MFRKKPNNNLIFLLLLAMSIFFVFFLSNQINSSVDRNSKSPKTIEFEFNNNYFTLYSIQQPDKSHNLLDLLADEVFETEDEESKEKLKKLSNNSLTCFSCCTLSCLFMKKNLSKRFLNKTTISNKPPLYTLYHCWKCFLHAV